MDLTRIFSGVADPARCYSVVRPEYGRPGEARCFADAIFVHPRLPGAYCQSHFEERSATYADLAGGWEVWAGSSLEEIEALMTPPKPQQPAQAPAQALAPRVPLPAPRSICPVTWNTRGTTITGVLDLESECPVLRGTMNGDVDYRVTYTFSTPTHLRRALAQIPMGRMITIEYLGQECSRGLRRCRSHATMTPTETSTGPAYLHEGAKGPKRYRVAVATSKTATPIQDEAREFAMLVASAQTMADSSDPGVSKVGRELLQKLEAQVRARVREAASMAKNPDLETQKIGRAILTNLTGQDFSTMEIV